MLRTMLVAAFGVALAGACGSTPVRPSSDEKPQPPESVASTPLPEPAESRAAAVVPIEPRGPLARGRCVDGFDCVDTVGFPASGYRWACVEGKCQKAKLAGFTGQTQEPTEAVSNTEPGNRSPKTQRSGRRHN